MTKTPEQMANEYATELWQNILECPLEYESAKNNFLAGYQAAKDQLADADKLIKPTEEIGRDELKCMIAHFENDDYKISVMVPGILPKDDGGELVRGCGLIVYELRKKVTK